MNLLVLLKNRHSPISIIAVLLILSNVPQIASAQDSFEDFKRQQQGMMQEFESFKKSIEKEFANYLEQQWEEFSQFKAQQLFSEPKITKPPVARSQTIEKKSNGQDQRVVELSAESAPKRNDFSLKNLFDDVQMPWSSAKPTSASKATQLGFFGLELSLPVNNKLQNIVARQPLNNKSISRYWKEINDIDNEPLQKRLLDIKKQLRLNDWGYFLLIQHVSEKLYKNVMQQRLFSWYLLNQIGYRIRVGYDANAVHLLVLTNGTMYGIPYFDIAKERFYKISAKRDQKNRATSKMYIYGKDFPGAKKAMKLDLHKLPQLPVQQQQYKFKFRYANNQYQLTSQVNANILGFYDSYPLISIDKLLATPMEQLVDDSLVEQLRQIITGKSELEAINILLRFVQTAFVYQRDEEQFGEERYLFAQQTVVSKASDCEDRAVLFAYLVRKLLGLSVVGIQYPGHLATAVRFSKPIKGDTILVGNQRYVICDPTYIRANAGEEMPQFRGKKKKIIRPALKG